VGKARVFLCDGKVEEDVPYLNGFRGGKEESVRKDAGCFATPKGASGARRAGTLAVGGQRNSF